MTEEPLQGEFLRDELAIDREFSQVRNWWVRYPKIVGNPLSIYLFIRSHRAGYRLTQTSVREQLGLGKDAFLKARRCLEEQGFLEVLDYVYPAGSRDGQGRSIGGHRLKQFRLLDPPKPVEMSAQTTSREATEENPPRVRAACGQTKEDFPPRVAATSSRGAMEDFPPRLVPHQGAAEAMEENPPRVAAACGQPKEGNPTSGFPPLKEDQDKENQDHSSSVENVTPEAVAASPDDDDSDLSSWFVDLVAGRAQLVGVRVDARAVLERIARQHPSIPSFDLVAATVEILKRARLSGTPIKHRDGYVASALSADLATFVRNFPVTAAPAAALAARPTQSGFGTTAHAATRACEERGHRFVIGPAHDRSCDRCGARELDLQAERDAAHAAAQQQCAASGHDWAQPTPHRVGTIAAGTILCRRCDVAASSNRQAVSR
ncbi:MULTISPECIES: hypothetical protein [unclassified Pseudoclavibacter]|uniref:hypothetical protein n=1 Tax=unclassified Pseudoclavibacter TaxID=2615177 RepID=UPI001BA4B497|nr:hypothetical protein [Pseudoclavibacter sp. Marseille-Q4354]MBS3177201.1 hypothetical protein [Pseudoclavibacter sp. Marseille-Q4354]